MTTIPNAPLTDKAWDPAADLTPVEVAVPASDMEGGGAATTALVFLCRFPGCGRQFQLKGNLKRHQHIHGGDKPFCCAFCGRSFLRKADMEVHLRVHTGEKPYACQYSGCGKRFARRSDLLSHERTHTGTKPFACAYPGCGRRFARRFDLHKHERSHDDSDSDVCGCVAATLNKTTMKRPCPYAQQDDEREAESEHEEEHAHHKKKTSAAVRTSGPSTPQLTGNAAPISPSDHANGPGKEFHFELRCTEDHVHTSPDCFTVEEWDVLLGTTATTSASTSTPTNAACCQAHGQGLAETFVATDATDAPAHPHTHTQSHAFDSVHQPLGIAASFPHTHPHPSPHFGSRSPLFSSVSARNLPSQFPHHTVEPQHLAFDILHSSFAGPPLSIGRLFPSPCLTPSQTPSLAPSLTPSRTSTDAMTSQLSSASLNSPCAVAATAKLHDYAAHTACGHLAIQHGDHRDFVVKNHLVCVDSVTSLSGDCGGSHTHASASASAHAIATSTQPHATKCAPQDPHRPGCGHLAVRHGDHIDYVVEDNLFCQLAGGLMEDAGHVELLDDDFWAFYGAIGSLKTE